MKRKYVYLMALTALTLGACSNEDGLFGSSDGGPQGQKQQVTFLFPGTAQGVVPYAGIASAEENEIKTLDVYVFGADKLATTNPQYLLEDVVKLKDGDAGLVTADKDDLKATLSIVGDNDKCLYFVANAGEESPLADYEMGVTDTLAFVKKQTRHLGKGLVKAPLLMTGRYMFAKTADGKMELTGPHTVVLNRRVARFDIINNAEESTLEIEKILIKGARPGTYFFGFGDANRPVYGEATVAELMEIDFLSFPTANVGTTGSVFYVYPTLTDGETSFQLKGHSTQSGEQMVQPVKMRLKQTGTVDETALLPIKANTRYIINVLAAGMANIDATITVKEWQMGQDVDVEAGFGLVKMTLAAPVTGVALTESKRLDVPSDVTAAFDIAVQADTEWEIVEKDNELTWIALTNRPAAGVVGKKFTLAITEKNPSSEPREKVLHIRNVKRPSVVQTLTVVQAGDSNGFKVEGDRLDNNTLMLFGAAGKTTLKLTLPSGVTAFDCEATDAWITLAKPAVTRLAATIDGSQLEVTVSANEGTTERTGSFTITVGDATQIIAVKQAPKNLGSIVVRGTGLANDQLSYKGTTQTGLSLLVTALTEWEVKAVDIDAQGAVTTTPTDWITDGAIVYDKADPKTNYNGRYNFGLAANPDFTERKSQMTFSNKLEPTAVKPVVITIIQQGKLETLTLTGTDYASDVLTFAADATTDATLTVATDKPAGTVTGLTVVKEASGTWFEVVATGDAITVTPTAHTGFSVRSATVTVKMAGAADKVFTVKQDAATRPTFAVSGKDLTGNALSMADTEFAAETYTVALTGATADALSMEKQADADWLTLDQTNLTTNGTFTLAATANTEATERTATVTITLANAAPMVITVTQAAAVIP